MTKRRRSEQYTALKHKTFETALQNFIEAQFPFVGGPKVIKLMVEEINQIYHQYHPKTLKPGQIIWMAVSKDEASTQRKGMRQLKKVPVVLTLVNSGDVQRHLEDMPMRKIRQHAIARMLREAKEQGGVLAEVDVAAILHCSTTTVSKDILNHEKEYNVVLPRRGTEHDLGATLTHKKQVIRGYNQKKATPDIAREIKHDPVACDRYINDYRRILKLLKIGVSGEEIPFVAGMSKSLASEYIDLAKEYQKDVFNDKNI
jgi:hypothetical protein